LPRAARLIWLIIGFASVALAILGAALPLLPTVPFLLLAAYAFGNSSDYFHNWLVTHKTFGPPIQNWRENGAISRRAKLYATVSIAATFGLSFVMKASWTIIGIQAVTLGCVMLFIWSRPEGTR